MCVQCISSLVRTCVLEARNQVLKKVAIQSLEEAYYRAPWEISESNEVRHRDEGRQVRGGSGRAETSAQGSRERTWGKRGRHA